MAKGDVRASVTPDGTSGREVELREQIRREIEAERAAQLEAEVDARIARLREAGERTAVHLRLCREHSVDPAVTPVAAVAQLEWRAAERHKGEVHAKHGPSADPARYARGSLSPLGGSAA